MPNSNSGKMGQPLPQARHQENNNLSDALRKIRHKIFVMSGKGGVGKSSVTVNLAGALADLGFKTGILDVDIHGPSVPRLLGIAEGTVSQVENEQIVPLTVRDKLRVLSLDTLMPERDHAIIWRGPKKAGAIQQLIGEAAWGELDFLVIDSPPGTGDEHLTILQMIPDALCLVVTTPAQVSLADVRKAVNFLQVLEARVLGVVENMGAFPCPHCGKDIELYGAGGALELARKYGLAFLGAIPFDPAASAAADKGVPAVFMEGNSPSKAAFFALAESVKNAAINFSSK